MIASKFLRFDDKLVQNPLEMAFEIYQSSVKNISFMTNKNWKFYLRKYLRRFLCISNDSKLIEGYNVEATS